MAVGPGPEWDAGQWGQPCGISGDAVFEIQQHAPACRAQSQGLLLTAAGTS